MSDVSDDLVVEILVRLPDSRSAIRCCLVCKRWNSLIAHDAHFARSFTRRRRTSDETRRCSFLLQRSRPLLVDWYRHPRHHLGRELYSLFSEGSQTVLVEKPPVYASAFPGVPAVIRASFEDLVLASWSYLGVTHYILLNPRTRRSAPLPAAPPAWPPSGYALACRPTGLGHTYRVAFFYPGGGGDGCIVWMFSSETGAWARVHAVPPPMEDGEDAAYHGERARGNDSAVVARGGTLHWETRDAEGRLRILALDPFAVRWSFVGPPEKRAGWEYWPDLMLIDEYALCLGACRDRLRACRLSAAADAASFESVLVLEVWELEDRHPPAAEGESSWRFVHGASFAVRHFVRYYWTASFHPNNPDRVFLYDRMHVSRYDMSERKLVKVADLRDGIGVELTVFSLVEPHWPTPLPRLLL